MKEIQVIAAWDWLPNERSIGTIACEVLRGTPTYRFRYDEEWLRDYPHMMLSADLPMVSGWQYRSGRIFALLQDALPDRWGRRLLDKRERITAEHEQRIPHTLSEADYLTLLDDATRAGGLRLKDDTGYLGLADDDYVVPPVAHIREFIDMAHEYERVEHDGGTLHEQWLLHLYRQGSSLGGARPKANVRDTDGTLYIAKIPSVHDDYDIALWEHFAHCLARQVGIHTAQTKLLKLDGQAYHTLLSRRFDRDGARRIHFASAMTLCGLNDGDDANSGKGYLDIVDAIIGSAGVTDIHAALVELYRRVAYYIIIGNHDDHYRNHGFLLSPQGWRWSPAYDINSTNAMTQSLLINSNSNDSSLRLLLDSCQEYMLDTTLAQSIIREVVEACRGWRKVATQCGISPSEQQRFAMRIDAMNDELGAIS